MGIAVCGFVVLSLALAVALVATVHHHFRVVGELLDRIVVLQGLPPVGRPIPELKAEPEEKKEPVNPRDRFIKDRVRFRVGV